MSKVYLVEAHPDEPEPALTRKIDTLWQRAGFSGLFEAHDLSALKLHVGEPGTRTFVPPKVVRPLLRNIEAAGATPYLTDTSVLYRSRRDNAVEHAKVVEEHGFGLAAVGAPFVAADGLNGADEIEVAVDGNHFQKVAIASGIMHARSLMVLTHATGHLGTGYGGALKNLGMGCCSKKAKLQQHHGQHPWIDAEACTACGTCADWCPSDAITVESAAAIDSEACIGCGECIAVCRDGAVEFDWGIMGAELQERIVEHAAAIVRAKPGRIGYVTVAWSITKDCDCMGKAQQGVVEDIGILASHDPVAIDQAVLELVRARAGRSLESLTYPRADAGVQIRRAVALGLGSAEVEIVPIEV